MTDPAASPAETPRPRRSHRIWFWIAIAGACAFVAFVALGILATPVVPRVLVKFHVASREKAELDIVAIRNAITEFAVNNGGKFPDKLELLVTPDVNGRAYLDSSPVPLDPWGRAYLYELPGPGNPQPRIVSYGKDGQPGGVGEDADIDSSSVDRAR